MKAKNVLGLLSLLALAQVQAGVAMADCDQKACRTEYNAAKERLNNIDNGSWDPATEQEYNDGKKALEVHDRCACAFQSPDIVQQVWKADKRAILVGIEKYEHGPRKLSETPELFNEYDKTYTWIYSPANGGCVPSNKMKPSNLLDRVNSRRSGMFYSVVKENKQKGFLLLSGTGSGGNGIFYSGKSACNACKLVGHCMDKNTKTYSRN